MQAGSPLQSPREVTPTKQQRSYSLEGLPDREILVFKSMVRLLSHRTNDLWVYSPSSTELRIVGEGHRSAHEDSHPVQQVLVVGTSSTKRPSYLQMPLHANELEAELNRLGVLMAPRSTAAGVFAAASIRSLPMRLLRWPPASVLTTPSRMRLATLMASKPLTVEDLQQRSQESHAVCAAFFVELTQLHLLTADLAASPPKIAPAHPPASTAVPYPNSPLVQPGLLGRIRIRLGLQTTRTTAHANRP